MPNSVQRTIRCQSCGQPFNIAIQMLVDVQQDPNAKVRLLSGQLNASPCPHCGSVNQVAVPLLYHDSGKELLVAYVPMELNQSKDQQEKTIGDLMNDLTRSIASESFKGYMFNPRRALTMQGLIDLILESDGVTPEMREQQRVRLRLAQSFISVSEQELPALVAEHDDKIDAQFFQLFTAMAQRVLQDGRPDVAEQILMVQQRIAELSSYGQKLLEKQQAQEKVVREVAEAIQALGKNAQRRDFLNLAVRYSDDEERLQALVGLIRPAFDYTFFQELTAYIGQAPSSDRDKLERLRQNLLELTAMIDQQAQVALQQAAGLLQALMSSPDPDTMIEENIEAIDDTFMAVLMANIQEADKHEDIPASTRLKGIYDKIITLLQANMQPELRFINELLTAESDDVVRTMIDAHARDFGEQLLEVMDGVGQALTERGDNEALLQRLAFLREETLAALS